MAFETRKAFAESKPREERIFEARVSLETREDGSTGLQLTGYASTTDQPYTIQDMFGEYTELIARGAFKRAVADHNDVRLLVNHEGIPIARTRGSEQDTMNLREIVDAGDDPQQRGQTGLWVDVPSLDGDSPLVRTVKSAMARGDLDQMSFAFQATRQEWNEDYTERTIREVKLFDVSVVTYPANPATSASMRDGAFEPKSAPLHVQPQSRLATAKAMSIALDLHLPA